MSFYCPSRLFIHSQNEATLVHKGPEDRNHFVGEKSLVSTWPAVLGRTPRVCHFTRSHANGEKCYRLETSDLPESTSSLLSLPRSQGLPAARAPAGQEVQFPAVAKDPRFSGSIPPHLWTHWQKSPPCPFWQNSAESKLKNELLACFLFNVYV